MQAGKRGSRGRPTALTPAPAGTTWIASLTLGEAGCLRGALLQPLRCRSRRAARQGAGGSCCGRVHRQPLHPLLRANCLRLTRFAHATSASGACERSACTLHSTSSCCPLLQEPSKEDLPMVLSEWARAKGNKACSAAVPYIVLRRSASAARPRCRPPISPPDHTPLASRSRSPIRPPAALAIRLPGLPGRSLRHATQALASQPSGSRRNPMRPIRSDPIRSDPIVFPVRARLLLTPLQAAAALKPLPAAAALKPRLAAAAPTALDNADTAGLLPLFTRRGWLLPRSRHRCWRRRPPTRKTPDTGSQMKHRIQCLE